MSAKRKGTATIEAALLFPMILLFIISGSSLMLRWYDQWHQNWEVHRQIEQQAQQKRERVGDIAAVPGTFASITQQTAQGVCSRFYVSECAWVLHLKQMGELFSEQEELPDEQGRSLGERSGS